MRLHRTVNICFLRRCRVSSRYPRVLPPEGTGDSGRDLTSISRTRRQSSRMDKASTHP
ncbi:hypothetical protein CSUI_007227, partial [Cystoisospora suis]